MSIKDVSFIGIIDDQGTVLYHLNFEKINVEQFLSSITIIPDDISLYNEQLCLASKNDEITILLLANEDSNEIFIKNAFDSFVIVLGKIIKEWKVFNVFEKYDQIVLAFNEFVFRGIILTDDPKELKKRIPKRSFENINGIKIKKGLASFINKTTKFSKKI